LRRGLGKLSPLATAGTLQWLQSISIIVRVLDTDNLAGHREKARYP